MRFGKKALAAVLAATVLISGCSANENAIGGNSSESTSGGADYPVSSSDDSVWSSVINNLPGVSTGSSDNSTGEGTGDGSSGTSNSGGNTGTSTPSGNADTSKPTGGGTTSTGNQTEGTKSTGNFN